MVRGCVDGDGDGELGECFLISGGIDGAVDDGVVDLLLLLMM